VVTPFRSEKKQVNWNSLLLRQENVLNPEEAAEEMEGNLLLTRILASNQLSIGAEEKLDAEQEVALKFYLRHMC
jgi:hypothetical protein